MMRQRGTRDLEFAGDFADHQPLRVCAEQQAHDAQARLGAHGRQHVGKTGYGVGIRRIRHGARINSVFLQYTNY
jgi:hypothetical protein